MRYTLELSLTYHAGGPSRSKANLNPEPQTLSSSLPKKRGKRKSTSVPVQEDHPELKQGEEYYWLNHSNYLTSISFGQEADWPTKSKEGLGCWLQGFVNFRFSEFSVEGLGLGSPKHSLLKAFVIGVGSNLVNSTCRHNGIFGLNPGNPTPSQTKLQL